MAYGQPIDVDTYPGEVGWFGGKLFKAAKKGVSSAVHTVGQGVKVVSHLPGVSTITAPISLASDIAHGKNVVRSVRNRANGVIKDTRAALPMAASVVSFVPGVGTAAGSAINAAAAISEGKSAKDIALAAAAGAIPGGALALQGVNVASDIAHGRNVIKSVTNRGLEYVSNNVPGGGLARSAVNVASDAVHGRNIVKSAANQGLNYVASKVPGGQIGRSAFGIVRSVANGQNVVQAATREGLTQLQANGAKVLGNTTMKFVNATRPSFGQLTNAAPEFIGNVRSAVGASMPQFRQQMVNTRAKASFRPLSSRGRSWLTRALPNMRGEVAGLNQSGTQWLVEAGDTGSKIAKALTGDANRWTELRAVNPKVMARGAAAIKKYGFPVYVGDLINLPTSWITVHTSPIAPNASATTVSIPGGDLAAQAQARTILVAWSKSDGYNFSGVTDYGAASEIGASQWSARDALQASSFANWWRSQGGKPEVTSGGNWSDSLAKALNAWAERKANAVTANAIAMTTPAAVTVTPVAMPADLAEQLSGGAVVPVASSPLAQPGATSLKPTASIAAAATTSPAAPAKSGMSSADKWGLVAMGVSTVGGIAAKHFL